MIQDMVNQVLFDLQIESRQLSVSWWRETPDWTITALVTADPDRQASGYLKWANPARIAEIVEKRRQLNLASGGGIPLPLVSTSKNVLFFAWPDDGALRSLRNVANLDKLKREIVQIDGVIPAGFRVRAEKSHLEVLRYKPEHRAVLRACLALKNDKNGEKSFITLILRVLPQREPLDLKSFGFDNLPADQFVAVLGELFDGTVRVEKFVEGRGLEDLMRQQLDDGHSTLDYLAEIRRRSAGIAVSMDEMRHRRLEQARAAAELCTRLAPHLTQRFNMRDIWCREAELTEETSTSTFVHGDFHPGQIIVTSRGPVLLDWTGAHRGDPREDSGLFLSHLDVLVENCPDLTRFLASTVHRLASETRPFFRFLGWVQEARRIHRTMFGADQPSVDRWIHRVLDGLRVDAAPCSKGSFVPDVPEHPVVDRFSNDQWTVEALFPHSRTPWGARLKSSNGENASALISPFDGRIHLMSPWEDPAFAAARPALEGADIVAYRPGRRLTARRKAGNGHQYLKCLPPSRFTRVLERELALATAAADTGILAPLISSSPDEGIITYAEVSGVSLFELRDTWNEELSHKVVALIRRFASLKPNRQIPFERVDAGDLPMEWLSLIPEIDMTPFRDVYSKQAATWKALREDVGMGLVHGDLHDKNILLLPDGSLRLIDTGGVHLGSRAVDPGNFAAHLLLRSMQDGSVERGRENARRFLDEWAHNEPDVDIVLVRSVLTLALFRLSVVYFCRRTRPGLWRDLLTETELW